MGFPPRCMQSHRIAAAAAEAQEVASGSAAARATEVAQATAAVREMAVAVYLSAAAARAAVRK